MSSLKIIPRKGNRPGTKKIEFGHEQLDTFSPDGFREKIIEEVNKWDAVTIGRSQVSEPSSVGFFVLDGKGPMDSFLFNNVKEFAHIHTTGFLHISLPFDIIDSIIENGWGEFHPVTRRPEFFNNLLMLYAPTNEEELLFVIEMIKISYERAIGN